MLFLRSLLFFCLQSMTVIIFALLAILVLPFPFKFRYQVISQWAVLNLWLVDKICGVKYQAKGLDNIPDQACVIMCKHQSAWETLALQALFPIQVWVLKRELLWIPFFGWGLAALNPIAIDRNAGRKALSQVIEQGTERLSSGNWVVIFPEGTRMPTGQMGRFGIGGARLAVDSGYPIVPVAHNAGTLWPKKGFIKYPGMITVVIGEMITTENKTATEVNAQTLQWMEQQMSYLENRQDISG